MGVASDGVGVTGVSFGMSREKGVGVACGRGVALAVGVAVGGGVSLGVGLGDGTEAGADVGSDVCPALASSEGGVGGFSLDAVVAETNAGSSVGATEEEGFGSPLVAGGAGVPDVVTKLPAMHNRTNGAESIITTSAAMIQPLGAAFGFFVIVSHSSPCPKRDGNLVSGGRGLLRPNIPSCR
jgi:hypothetical protein